MQIFTLKTLPRIGYKTCLKYRICSHNKRFCSMSVQCSKNWLQLQCRLPQCLASRPSGCTRECEMTATLQVWQIARHEEDLEGQGCKSVGCWCKYVCVDVCVDGRQKKRDKQRLRTKYAWTRSKASVVESSLQLFHQMDTTSLAVLSRCTVKFILWDTAQQPDAVTHCWHQGKHIYPHIFFSLSFVVQPNFNTRDFLCTVSRGFAG